MNLGHSVNNKQLLWVEPISSVKLDIAARSTQFFEKRDISENLNYQPNVRSLQYDDSLRLSVDAFNKTIYLHLTPNYDLFHPDAVVHQQGRSVALNPSQYRVYRGYVIDDIYSDHWWISGLEEDMENQPGVLGWARITVRPDIQHTLDYPIFEGAFTVYGDTHHIKLTDNYHLTKRSDDATLLDKHDAHMIMYRDSDTVEEKVLTGGCGFDNLKHEKRLYNPLEVTDYNTPFGIKQFGAINTHHQLGKRAPPTGCPTAKKSK